MKARTVRWAVVIGLASLLLLVVVGERVLSYWLKQQILLKAQALNIEVGSVSLSTFTRTARLYDIRWSPDSISADTDSSTHVSIEKLTVRGVRLYPLLRDRALSIRALIVENGNVRIRHPKKSKVAPKTFTPNIEGVHITSFRITNTFFSIDTDSLTTWSGTAADVELGQVKLKGDQDLREISSYEVPYIDILVNGLTMKKVNGYYDLSIGRTKFDRRAKTLQLDSLKVTPTYSKVEFARKRGTQSTWAKVMIPIVEIRGLDLKGHLDSTYMASSVVITRARIDAYRDKRVPLLRTAEMPLPMKWLKGLKIALEIDSIEVEDMEVNYEHMAENGFSPGKFRLENLDALFRNVGNREYDNQPTVITVNASTRIMGAGELSAEFLFPLSARARYQAKGRLRGLSLTSLNPLLENAAFVSIESGQLNDLQFQFSYNNDVSEGRVDIDYDNLKLRGLKKERGHEVDKLKTLIANTAIKNQRIRSGTIHNERDKRRFIFHYWASSLMDGIQNAVIPAAPEKKKE